MKKVFLPFLLLPLAYVSSAGVYADDNVRTLKIYDEAVFYDGYNGTVFDADADDGIIRHANHLYARRLSDEELNWFGEDLTLDVTIGALCDNYDRIGNINLAFVPKGDAGYNPYETTRIEIARFITPFMNKNVSPDEVPYSYSLPALSLIMRDASLREKYDYYVEFELFGVPYAANQQVAGCADRNDVFRGSLAFSSADEPMPAIEGHTLVPVVIKKPESMGHNLNNYSEAGTDTIGVCTKTYTFDIPSDMSDSRMVLITSNHGANENGEEYVRRKHLVYVDGELTEVYTPGGKSCEPYRKYNTQGNGIYGFYKRPAAWWESWNNWCPGSAIPVREIDLGALSAGRHSVMLRVPDAEFAGGQGDFPVSIYVQGVNEGVLPAGVSSLSAERTVIAARCVDGILHYDLSAGIDEVEIYDMEGRLCYGTRRIDGEIDLRGLVAGIYVAVFNNIEGQTSFVKFAR